MSADGPLPREGAWPSFSALTSALRGLEVHLWGVRWLHPDAGADALDAAAMRFVEERLDEHRMLLSEATGFDAGAESTRFDVTRSAHEAARLDDETAARVHCVLEILRDDCTVIDLGSSDGTLLDGARVNKASLRDGSVLRAGASELRFTFERAEP